MHVMDQAKYELFRVIRFQWSKTIDWFVLFVNMHSSRIFVIDLELSTNIPFQVPTYPLTSNKVNSLANALFKMTMITSNVYLL